MRLSQPLGLQLEEEQWQKAVVEVTGGRSLEVGDKDLVQLVIGRWLLHRLMRLVREGEEGENEQVQDEELPPQPTLEMINQVLNLS